MSKCSKCGKQIKESSKFCASCGGHASLDEKKARVLGQEKTWVKPALIAAAIVLVVVGGLGFNSYRAKSMDGQAMFPPDRNGSARVSNAAVVTAQNGEIRIPIKTVEDGNSHFFAYATGGKTVTFFVMKAADGSVRTAFDACVACNHAKLGYRQEGKVVVCNNCGMGFTPADIGKVTGGCSPIPIEKTSDGQMLVLKAKDLEAGVEYF
jgi:hypothetical protein